jgi:ERCC4-type nuclease
MVVVACDIHERWSTVPARLRGLGVAVEMTTLAAGDYLIGRTAVVERKRVDDLHGSVIRGRFWSQIGRLRVGPLDPYLLIEGPDIDDGPLSPTAVRGCVIAAINLGVRLLRSTDAADSALWLQRLVVRHGERPPRRDRPLFTQRPKARPPSAPEAILAAVPGISHQSAGALLERFGSVRGVLDAGPDAWRGVKGIGAVRARALAEALAAPGRVIH